MFNQVGQRDFPRGSFTSLSVRKTTKISPRKDHCGLAEADSEEWLNQLQVIGADFRFLAGVEEMCWMLCREAGVQLE